MTGTKKSDRSLMYFMLLYGIAYMTDPIFGSFLSVYLSQQGYNAAAIGVLLSIGPFIAGFAQPVWGTIADRANTKNSVLKAVIIGSSLMMAAYPLSNNFFYLFLITAVFIFFRTSQHPLEDTITLEYLSQAGGKFGVIRMAGTIGYAVMSVLIGVCANRNIYSIFPLYVLFGLATLFVIHRLPEVKGHQRKGGKVSLLKLFEHRELLLLIFFCFIIQMTGGFSSSFFPLYFTNEIGGNSTLLGWILFVSAITEIPFLFFGDTLLTKLGRRNILLISAFGLALRFILTYWVTNPYWQLPVQALQGPSFILMHFAMVTYINDEVPMELKASGQTMYNLIAFGGSRIVSNLLGGLLGGMVGIRIIFLYNSFLTLAVTLVFGLFFLKTRRRRIAVEVCQRR